MSDDVTDFDPREVEPADPPNNGAIRTWSDGRDLQVKGRDSGAGIAPETLTLGPNGERTLVWDTELNALVVHD